MWNLEIITENLKKSETVGLLKFDKQQQWFIWLFNIVMQQENRFYVSCFLPAW
jgi:hypothetical protein